MGCMGIIVNQQDNRSELQKKIAAELSDKAKKKQTAKNDLPDGIDDSAFIEGTKTTTGLAGVWIAIVLIAVAILIWFFISAAGNQF